MLTRYKYRADLFTDICIFCKWLLKYNRNRKNIIKISNVLCKDLEDGVTEFEFDSNIDDFMKLRKLMMRCDPDIYIMFETLLPIERYTGIRDEYNDK